MARHTLGRVSVNPVRSSYIRLKLEEICSELGISYSVIASKAVMTRSTMSNFVTKKADLSDFSLDKLEPVLNKYMAALETYRSYEGK